MGVKNIFIGGYGSCGVHNEKPLLIMLVNRLGLNLVRDIECADLIILTDTCIGSYEHIPKFVEIIRNVLERKKSSSMLVVSGCLANGVKVDLAKEYVDFFNSLCKVSSKELIPFILNYICRSNKLSSIGFNSVPFKLLDFGIRFSLCDGCLNNCSFCKVAFANFPLISYSLDDLDKLIDIMKSGTRPIVYVDIFSSNFSLYGVDCYNSSMAHEALRRVSSVDSVKYIKCGSIINFYPELIDELVSNPKIRVVDISLESGSSRVYDMMNRPISFSEWVEIVKYIRKRRPDMLIKTELIAGFPRETVEDIISTIALVKELGLYVTAVWEYNSLPFTASSQLEQHSKLYIRKSKSYYDRMLKDWNDEVLKKFVRGEAYIAFYDEKLDHYSVVFPDGMVTFLSRISLGVDYKVGDVVYFTWDDKGICRKRCI